MPQLQYKNYNISYCAVFKLQNNIKFCSRGTQ